MKETIREQYNSLYDNIQDNYNKITIIDNWDFTSNNPYTIFYLSKNESFDKVNDIWKECLNKDLSYDDVLWEFDKRITENNIDCIELGTLNIYTDSEYELEI